MNKHHFPRIMLAAPASGSGKTMITCGILQTFVNRGLNPASFKCGPDYIDPMFHTKVIGTRSRNLDTFFTEPDITRYLFSRIASGAGISVLEGVMGIYDGLGGISPRASSYELACVTDTPVILIVNARGMSLSVIPMIQGYLDYQKKLGKNVIQGVILNQTTKMTYLLLKNLIEEQTGIQALGYVPRLENCTIESRHLGLVTPDEITDLRQTLNRLSEQLEESLDMNGILDLAEHASDYQETDTIIPERIGTFLKEKKRFDVPIRIAVARDEAFCFYYQDNLDLLNLLGAELVEFSPLRDKQLPERISGLILGGGYPELYVKQLSDNFSIRNEIKERIAEGLPYLAECGGFMYLHEEMEDMEGNLYPVCGWISGKSYRTPRLGRFGYITLCQAEDTDKEQLLSRDTCIRGHEFHYFDSTNTGEDYLAKKPTGKRSWTCIHGNEKSAAGYPHLYYWSNPSFAAAFLAAADQYNQTKGHM